MVETMNNIRNRQPDSNAGCSKQKGVKNKQTQQLVLWIGALIIGAVLGIFGISWLDGLMNFIATVYTRLFQLLAVPTIALAVITTLASLGNQAETYILYPTVRCPLYLPMYPDSSWKNHEWEVHNLFPSVSYAILQTSMYCPDSCPM